METGNATIPEEPLQEYPEPACQSCALSPEVSPSQQTKSIILVSVQLFHI